MQFAILFYRLRLSEEKDEDVLMPDLLNMPNGVFPELITFTSAQDEIARIANEVTSFINKAFHERICFCCTRMVRASKP